MAQDDAGRAQSLRLPSMALDPEQRDIQADVTLLRTEEGGLRCLAQSYYFRRQVYYDSLDWDALFEFIPAEWAFPGQTAPTYLSFLSPQCHVGRLIEGKAFLIRQGQQVIGRGVVTAILNLEFNARGRHCNDPRVTAQD